MMLMLYLPDATPEDRNQGRGPMTGLRIEAEGRTKERERASRLGFRQCSIVQFFSATTSEVNLRGPEVRTVSNQLSTDSQIQKQDQHTNEGRLSVIDKNLP